jgi:hypothetical protein
MVNFGVVGGPILLTDENVGIHLILTAPSFPPVDSSTQMTWVASASVPASHGAIFPSVASRVADTSSPAYGVAASHGLIAYGDLS